MFRPSRAGREDAEDLETSVTRLGRIGLCLSPSLSPDGKQIAFVSDLNGVPQVWIADANGGWPHLVTALDDQIAQVRWSPEGDWLAFALAPGGGMNRQVFKVRPDGTGLRRLTEGGKENNWLGPWAHDGRSLAIASNREKPEAMDAYLVDIANGGWRLVAENRGIGEVLDITRDARFALLWRMVSRSDDNLYLVDLVNRQEVLLTPHDGPGSFQLGRFAPDGRIVYLSSNKDRDLTAFARVKLREDRTAGPIEVLLERDDGELELFEITEDGKLAALVWNVAGRNELVLVNMDGLEVVAKPKLPAELLSDLSFSKDGRLLALNVSGSTAPTDVWVLEVGTGRLWQVTHSPHAGVDLHDLVRPELVGFRAHDGLELTGWLYRPVGHSGPTPMVLSFHGGPEMQERPSFVRMYQSLLAQGIGVFAPNVRGSAGFGKTFVNLDNGALRVNAVKDIESCVQYVVQARVADPKRIGIMGGSYGGYMTMAGLTEFPDLFAAAADLYGVVNFETFFANSEPWMAAISKVEYGDPSTEVEMLRHLSPIHRIDRVRAPTIVLHGANDTNVPVVEAEQVVENLKRRGVPVEYILFPDEGHGFMKTANRIRATVAVVRWFAQRLRAPLEETTPE